MNMQMHPINEGDRFSRETAAGYDRSIIDSADVVLVGCGALGQAIAQLLSLIGFPRVLFIDGDTFEPSNATRSWFFQRDRLKAEAVAIGARAACTALPPPAYRYAACWVQGLGDAIFQAPAGRRVIVFSAVDSQVARLWLAQRCRWLGIPLIEGGFDGRRFNLSVFGNSDSQEPCWACGRQVIQQARVFSCEAYARRVKAAGFVPATATVAFALAAAMVEAGVAILHDDRGQVGRTQFHELRSGHSAQMIRARDPHCRVDHQVVGPPTHALAVSPEQTVDDLFAALAPLLREPVVQLPASFIRTVPCADCHRMLLLNQPEWAIQAAPTCQACGGPWPPATHEPPERFGTLSSANIAPVQSMPLRTLGLGPGLHLAVEARAHRVIVRLAGEPDQIVQVDPYRPCGPVDVDVSFSL